MHFFLLSGGSFPTKVNLWSCILTGAQISVVLRELQEAFQAMEPELQKKLCAYQLTFKLSPSSSPHVGGIWEREI